VTAMSDNIGNRTAVMEYSEKINKKSECGQNRRRLVPQILRIRGAFEHISHVATGFGSFPSFPTKLT
jgi:hypothetical protein